MQVRLEISGSTFTAHLKLPRALVLSAALAIAGIVTNAWHIYVELGQVRQQLAECERRLDALSAARVGE